MVLCFTDQMGNRTVEIHHHRYYYYLDRAVHLHAFAIFIGSHAYSHINAQFMRLHNLMGAHTTTAPSNHNKQSN